MRKNLLITAVMLLGASLFAETGDSEGTRSDRTITSISTGEGIKTLTLVQEYDPSTSTLLDAYVYYLRVRLTKGKNYVFWITNHTSPTDADIEIYPTNSKSDFWVKTIAGQDYWYINDTLWEPGDAAGDYTFYVRIDGNKGDSCKFHYQERDIRTMIPLGDPENKEPLSLKNATNVSRTAPDGVSYYFSAAFEAGDYYCFERNATDTRVHVSSASWATVIEIEGKTYVKASQSGTLTIEGACSGGSVSFKWSKVTPEVVRFSSTSLGADQAQSKVSLSVQRTGSTPACSVKWSTVPLTASGNHEYEAAGDILRFAAGETSKTIDIVLTPGKHGGWNGETRAFAVRFEDSGENELPVEIADNVATVTLSDSREPAADTGTDANENVWSFKSHVTFNANGGSVSPTGYDGFTGGTFTVPTPLRSSRYEFLKWTGSDGRTYLAGETYFMPAVSLTLTAKWNQLVGDIEGALIPSDSAKGIGTSVKFVNGSYPWVIVTDKVYDGEDAMASAAGLSNGKTSTLEMQMPEATSGGTLTFYWAVSSYISSTPDDSKKSYLTVYVDGKEKAKICGSVGWTKVSLPLAASPSGHVIKWSFKRVSSASYGSDMRGWLDCVKWTPDQVTASFSGNGGTGTVSPFKADVDSYIVLPEGTSLTKAGWEFRGWTSPDGIVRYPGDLWRMGGSDAAFSAVWEQPADVPTQSVNVFFDTGDAAQAYDVGEALAALPLPTLTGSRFLYWTMSSGERVTGDALADLALDGETLVSSWAAEPVKPADPEVGGLPTSVAGLVMAVNTRRPAKLAAGSASVSGNVLTCGGETVEFPGYYKVSISEPQDGFVTLSVELDEGKVRPQIDKEAENPVLYSEGMMTIAVGNVYGGLWYGLSKATDVAGEYVPQAESFRKAEADGAPLELQVESTDPAAFFRVLVDDVHE